MELLRCSRSGWRSRRRPAIPKGRHVVPGIAVVLLLAGCGSSSSSQSASRSRTAIPPSPPTGSWTSSTPVDSGPFSQLVYAQCNGSTDCYADGFGQGGSAFSEFLQHWDGKSWTSSVGPVGTGSAPGVNELDCLPSGFCVVPLNANQVSIYSVVAGRWTQMLSDNPTSATRPDATVNSVACISETRCLGVGAAGNGAGTDASALGLVWNGNRWKSTVLPRQGADPIQHLVSVSCGSGSFCIGVGYSARDAAERALGHAAIAARWNGSTWTPLAVPGGTRLDNVVCISPSSCIAVGADGTGGILLHWHGSSWVKEQSPLTGPYFAINCASENLCMALQRPNASQPLGTVPVALRWYGHWYKVTGYPAPAAYLEGVSCYSGGCLVVGQARSTPSTAAQDVAGAQATAAFYNIGTGGATATTSSASSSSSASSASTHDPVGLWSGRVTQHGPGAYKTSYDVLMKVVGRRPGDIVGRIGYAPLNCAGELALISVHGASYVYRERILVGRKQCTSGGTIYTTVSGNSMSWRWVAGGVTVRGVLGRSGSHVRITGALTATLTARPQECSSLKGVQTIQLRGLDSGGAEVVLTVTDQQKGGWAQILIGDTAYVFQGKGRLTVTPLNASFSNVVMPNTDPAGHGTVTVNGNMHC